ncbi:MAG: hypothetical protein ACM31C_27090 [Acidobacteriota bacterium]
MTGPRHFWIIAIAIALAPARARAGEIPIITLTDVGPDQDIPTDRSFFLSGEVGSTVETAQAIVVRKGSPSLFGDDGPDCRELIAGLHLEPTSTSAADDEDDSDDDELPAVPARYGAGRHRVFEVFANAAPELRDDDVLISAAWQRTSDASRQYKVLVPHDPEFFSAGHGYCLFVVASERAQDLDDGTLGEMIDRLARELVACGDKSSCDDDALADYGARAARELASAHTVVAISPNAVKAIAMSLKEAARTELAASTGIVEARDHLQDRWTDKLEVMTPAAQVVWADAATDPFAHALVTMLARSAALLPQVRAARKGTAVALYTTDGKLQVNALQLLEDRRSIRVASSKSPAGDQARVLDATTDTLPIADGLVLTDLIELGRGRVHVDKEWVELSDVGERLSGIALEEWTTDDAAYLAAATTQLHRIADFVDAATSGASCPRQGLESTEAEQTSDAVRRHLGEWLVCQHVDGGLLAELAEQLDELDHEDEAWKAAKDKLVARSKRIATVTTTAPVAARVEFASRTWAFSYVTPMVGYAGVIRPDESFGLFYLGAQLHFAPNPIDDVLWHDGVTVKDLQRSVGIELGLAPTTSSFGPDRRYDGPAGLPPIFLGLAVHVVPYTSITFGGTILDRKQSSLVEEQPKAIFAPYVGFTLQLNVPDLIRQAAHPGSDTTAIR